MSDLTDRIERLEEAVQSAAEKVGLPVSAERLQEMVTEAVLEALDASVDSLDELADLDDDELAAIVRRALDQLYPTWTARARRDVSRRLLEMVTEAEAFYREQDLDVSGLREAVGRSQRARQVGEALEAGMRHVDDQIREATIDGIRDQIRRGELDRQQLAIRIEEEAGTSAYQARITARAAVGAYNQVYRNELSRRSDLPHLFYYGPVMRNTRPFCRIHRDRVFTPEQVEQMENAQLEPPSVHRGGYNCIHSWLPVNADWDDELAAKVVDQQTATEVEVDQRGLRTIKVFADPPRVERLKAQIPLSRAGYEQILDAETNDEGFVAIDRGWIAELTADRRTKRYRRMIEIRDRARELAEEGHVVRLSAREQADMIVDGEEINLD